MATEVIPFLSDGSIAWDIIGGGLTFGAELQPNADMDGTAGIFSGTGVPSGDIATAWQCFMSGNPTGTVTGSKTIDDYQTIETDDLNVLLTANATRPTLVDGTLYRARVILEDVVGSIVWQVRDSGLTEIQFTTSITEGGTHDYYFIATANIDVSTYLDLSFNESAIGISEISLKEVLTTAGYLAIAENDADASYIEATAAATAQFNALNMSNLADDINFVTVRHISRFEGISGTRIRTRLRFNDTTTDTGAEVTPIGSYVQVDENYLTNVVTGEPFTRAEINGIGTSGIDVVIFQAISFTIGSNIRTTYGAVLVDYEARAVDIMSPVMTKVMTPVMQPTMDAGTAGITYWESEIDEFLLTPTGDLWTTVLDEEVE